jgi:hypothetical protein
MIDENKIGVRVCWRLSGATPPNGYKGNSYPTTKVTYSHDNFLNFIYLRGN